MTFFHLNNLEYVDFKGNDGCTSYGTLTRKELHMLSSDKINNFCKKHDVLTGCSFMTEEFLYVGTAFTCITSNINLTDYRTYLYGRLYRINGFENSPQPVKVLFTKDQTCNFMPAIHSIYIEAIYIVNSKLENLSKHDMLGAPNLKSLVVSSNLLKIFDFSMVTKNLLHIDCRNNEIKRIESIESIKNSMLQSVQLEGNICIDENFEDDLSSINGIAADCVQTKKLPTSRDTLFWEILEQICLNPWYLGSEVTQMKFLF